MTNGTIDKVIITPKQDKTNCVLTKDRVNINVKFNVLQMTSQEAKEDAWILVCRVAKS